MGVGIENFETSCTSVKCNDDDIVDCIKKASEHSEGGTGDEEPDATRQLRKCLRYNREYEQRQNSPQEEMMGGRDEMGLDQGQRVQGTQHFQGNMGLPTSERSFMPMEKTI